jgi:hypothetical protein
MLRRRGWPAQIRIGVLPQTVSAGRLESHVWVDVGGIAVIGDLDNLSDYALLTAVRQPD